LSSITEGPVKYRVLWFHPVNRLSSRSLRQRTQDFGSEAEALSFLRSLRERFPNLLSLIIAKKQGTP
jgi:hypothetical protein